MFSVQGQSATILSQGNNLEWLPKFHRIPVLSQQKMNNWRFAKKLHVLANPENALIVVGTLNQSNNYQMLNARHSLLLLIKLSSPPSASSLECDRAVAGDRVVTSCHESR